MSNTSIVDWLAFGVALIAVGISLGKVWWDVRKDRPHVGIYFSYTSEDLTVSIVNTGYQPLYIQGAALATPENSDSPKSVGLDLRIKGRPERIAPLQAKQPLLYTLSAKNVFTYEAMGLSVVTVETSDTKQYREPIPDDVLDYLHAHHKGESPA